MVRWPLFVGLLAILTFSRAQAIEDVTTSTYNDQAAPTNANIANWTTGWTQPATQPTGYTSTTGWNYVGMIDGNSAVYLGNGWVVTAAHVVAGDFTLNTMVYPMVANSAHFFGSADLVLFQVSPYPALPPLTLRSTDPRASYSQVVMIGYGHVDGTRLESWGYDTINVINQAMTLTANSTTYTSNDFLTLDRNSSNGQHNTTNDYQIVIGDSGGADFIFNRSSQSWGLAGINEINGTVTYSDGSTQDYSGFVQLDTYATQIEQVMTVAASTATDSPTMPQWALITLAGLLVLFAAPRKFMGKRNLA